ALSTKPERRAPSRTKGRRLFSSPDAEVQAVILQIMKPDLLFPNFDAFSWGANAARSQPDHEGEASHSRDRDHEWPSRLAEHVTDSSSECGRGGLLREPYKRRSRASATREWRHGAREPLRHRQA